MWIYVGYFLTSVSICILSKYSYVLVSVSTEKSEYRKL